MQCSRIVGCFPASDSAKPVEHVQDCKKWYCTKSPPISSLNDWSNVKSSPEFAADVDQGTGNCCAKLLETWDVKADFCDSDAEPVMDAKACINYLCGTSPAITDNGASLVEWQAQHENSPSAFKQRVEECISTLHNDDTSSWPEECSGPDPAESAETTKFLEDLVGKRLTADDLKQVEAMDNPNENALVPIEPSGATCADGVPENPKLPGTDILGAGYDPALKPGCEFEQCMTRQVYKWTYNKCNTLHSPGGTFSVPDQIKVFNIYNVHAATHVYSSAKEEASSLAIDAGLSAAYSAWAWSASMAASFGWSESSAKSSNQHKAIRAVDIDLYSLKTMPPSSMDGLSPDFVAHYNSLPERFGFAPHRFMEFVRTWGRFVTIGGRWGGTLDINMFFSSSSSASKRDMSVGVEAAFDGMFSAKVHFNLDHSKSAKSLASNSRITLTASGGDPGIAATITDLQPGMEKSARFRDDFMAWIKSVPLHPRMAQRMPSLQTLTSIIPASGKTTDIMRKKALEFAVGVFSSDPQAAMGASSQTCTGKSSGIKFSDFNRFQKGDCLAFSASSSSALKVELTGTPGDIAGGYLLDITTNGVNLYRGNDRKNPVATSMNPSAFAVPDASLLADYWVCITASGSNEHIEYGKGSTKMLTYDDSQGLSPQFFGLGCESHAAFSAISVFKAKDFKIWTEENTACIIAKCKNTDVSDGKCSCTKCASGYRVVEGGAKCQRVSTCPNKVGCTNLDSKTCECRACCCGLALHPTTKACLENGVWTQAYPAVQFSKAAGDKFEAKVKKMDILPDEYYRIKDLQLTCSENAGLVSLAVRHTKMLDKPPIWDSDIKLKYGALVGDSSYADEDLILRSYLENNPKTKPLMERLGNFFKGDHLGNMVKSAIPFGLGDNIDFADLGNIFKKGIDVVKEHGGKALGAAKDLVSGKLDIASALQDFNINLDDPAISGIIGSLGDAGKLVGNIGKAALSAVDMVDWAMNDSPLGNVIGLIPGAGTVSSAIQIASKYIPTDVAKLAIDGLTGEEVPIDKVIEAGMKGLKLPEIDIPNLGSIGGKKRMLLSETSSANHDHLRLFQQLAEAKVAVAPSLSSKGGIPLRSKEKGYHQLSSEAKLESLAWKWALAMHHHDILKAFEDHARKVSLSATEQRKQELFLADAFNKLKDGAGKLLEKGVSAFEKVGKGVTDTIRTINPKLADNIESTYKAGKEALLGPVVDAKTLWEFFQDMNSDDDALYDGKLDTWDSMEMITENTVKAPNFYQMTGFAFNCKEITESDRESGISDVGIAYTTGNIQTKSSKAFYFGAAENAQISQDVYESMSNVVTLEQDEFLLAVQIARTKYGVQSVTGYKTNKKFHSLQCGPPKPDKEGVSVMYSACEYGKGGIGLYGAMQQEGGGLRAIGILCAGAQGDWQEIGASNDFYYPQVQFSYATRMYWPSNLRQRSKSVFGSVLYSEFMSMERVRVSGLELYCSSDAVASIALEYDDGRGTIKKEFIGAPFKKLSSFTKKEYVFPIGERLTGFRASARYSNKLDGIYTIYTTQQTIDVPDCGRQRARTVARSQTCPVELPDESSPTFKGGVIGLRAQMIRGRSEIGWLGLECAKPKSDDPFMDTKAHSIEMEEGEYLTGMIGVLTPVSDPKAGAGAQGMSAAVKNRLGGVSTILTNNKVLPISCGSEIGEHAIANIPNNGMPLNFFASSHSDGLTSLGFQYATIPTEAENGFILQSTKSIKLSKPAGRKMSDFVGKSKKNDIKADMVKSFFNFYVQQYLRLEILEFQCVYEAGYTYLSAMTITFSNKDKFVIGKKIENTMNAHNRIVELAPNENLESIEFFVNKAGLLTGISEAATDQATSRLNCGAGASTSTVSAKRGKHIVGFDAYFKPSRSHPDRGQITQLTALTIDKTGVV
ncbi:MAG: hypothetical protein CMO45_11575 [Verrucomicrobiales bacterium]|nr:hypothetical protein [Verrucomicrobiales bacterium]